MLTVGITGGIGSGKTALTDILQDMGVVIVDADAIPAWSLNRAVPHSPKLPIISGHSVLRPRVP